MSFKEQDVQDGKVKQLLIAMEKVELNSAEKYTLGKKVCLQLTESQRKELFEEFMERDEEEQGEEESMPNQLPCGSENKFAHSSRSKNEIKK